MNFFPRKESKPAPFRDAIPLTVLTVASLLWTAGTMAAPFLAASGHPLAALAAKWIYAPFCHQQLSRSLSLFGFPVSVCHRCLAIYVSFTLVLLLSGMLVRGRGFSRLALLCFLLPMLSDFLFDVAGLWTNTPVTRMASGVVAGIGLAYFLVPAMRELGREMRDRRLCSTVTQGN